MTAKPILTINLVSDRYTLVNATPGFTWPEALKNIYPNDESEPFTIPIAKQHGYYLYNYTEHCQESLFYPGTMLYDCTAIAIAAIMVQEGGYTLTADNIQKVNQSLQVEDLKTFNGVRVFNQILNCTRASCQASETENGRLLEDQFGPCGDDIINLPESFSKVEDLPKILSPLESLCSRVKELKPRVPEPDIAGPGITMAYIMQIFLATWFILLSILIPKDPKSSFAAKTAKNLRRLKRRYLKQNNLREERTEPWLESLRDSRFSEAMFSSLVEFQEAQVFFTLAVQLASISMLVLNESISARRIDWTAAKLFQAGNTLVVLLVQAEMQRKKMHWWYTYLLTLMVCVFFLAIQHIGLDNEVSGLDPRPECGVVSIASILETCSPDYLAISGFDQDVMENSFEAYLGIVLFSIGFITLDQVSQIPRLRNWIVDVWDRKSEAVKRMIKIGSVLWSLLWFLMNFFLAYLLVWTTSTIIHEVGDSLSQKESWTFGQIVAVLLWAPVVFKYIYLNIFGVKRGVESRIDSHYRVVSDRPQLPPGPSHQSLDGIPLNDIGYKNVSNNEDEREYGDLEDPRIPTGARLSAASGRDSVRSMEQQSFTW